MIAATLKDKTLHATAFQVLEQNFNNNNSINKRAAGADALSTIYGSKPPRTKAKSRGQGWFNVAINFIIIIISTEMKNACYIYLS